MCSKTIKSSCHNSMSLHNLNVLCVQDTGSLVPYLPQWKGTIVSGLCSSELILPELETRSKSGKREDFQNFKV